MSKGPDLSAFPIPRKGGARPISMDELPDSDVSPEDRGGEGPQTEAAGKTATKARDSAVTAPASSGATPKRRTLHPISQAQPAPLSGQVVATTVKLDEGRYLRLVNAGQPGPGRLKRRTIQEMMVEAIDEWFERRGL